MKKWIKQDQPTPALARKRPGAPKGNQNGRRHGLYSRLYPVDFIDTLPRLRHEQGHRPMDPAAARRLDSFSPMQHNPFLIGIGPSGAMRRNARQWGFSYNQGRSSRRNARHSTQAELGDLRYTRNSGLPSCTQFNSTVPSRRRQRVAPAAPAVDRSPSRADTARTLATNLQTVS